MTDLKKSLGPIQFFSIGFGGIVGVGWIVYLGIWFQSAGPVGTVIALLVGGLLMTLVGLCYAELGAAYPVAGGEVVYVERAFGPRTAFLVGWAFMLTMTAVIPYISITLAWMLDVLFPGFRGPLLYSWRGHDVHLVSLLISLGWTVWLAFLNYRGVHGAAKFQDWMTYGKVAISLLFIGAGLFGGSLGNLEPPFVASSSGSMLPGMLAVAVTVPWFLSGFNEIPQLFEERSPSASPRVLGLIVVAVVLAAAAYYAIAAFAIGMVTPWQSILTQELPAASAFKLRFGNEFFTRVVLVSGVFGILTVGNGASLAGSRLLFAMSRARMVSPAFERLHPRTGAPVVAIVFIMGLGIGLNFLGRGGVVPIVSVGSAAVSLAYFFACLSLPRLRQLDPDRPRPYRLPGGPAVAILAAAGSLTLLVSSFRQHWIDAGRSFPLEWAIVILWALIGVGVWRAAARARAELSPEERARIMMGQS